MVPDMEGAGYRGMCRRGGCWMWREVEIGGWCIWRRVDVQMWRVMIKEGCVDVEAAGYRGRWRGGGRW